MKIKWEQLASSLQQKLAFVYLIVGEELLLMEECQHMIREEARRRQFDERQVF